MVHRSLRWRPVQPLAVFRCFNAIMFHVVYRAGPRRAALLITPPFHLLPVCPVPIAPRRKIDNKDAPFVVGSTWGESGRGDQGPTDPSLRSSNPGPSALISICLAGAVPTLRFSLV